jgi:Putative phage tail protein
MASIVLGAVGAVIGGYFGGPEGAALGWAIGSAGGMLLFPTKGPNPSDLKLQDSAYGKPIPTTFGLYRLTGNVIWAGQPVENDGGKGGSSSGPTVNMSFAVGLCEGPITGVRRIWANGVLIYDFSNPSNFQNITGSAAMITGFTVYLGDELQLADPTMEAALGAANTPPNRGLAYVVFNQLDLSQWGNYLPTLSFEVLVGQEVSYVTALNENPPDYALWEANDNYVTQFDASGSYGFQIGLPLPGSGASGGIQPFRCTSYGAFFYGPMLAVGTIFLQAVCQTYDEFGCIDSEGKWYTILGFQYNTGLTSLAGGEGASVIKKNDVFYQGFWDGGSGNFPILIYKLVGETTISSDTPGGWFVVGVTDNFIYAIGISPYDTTHYQCLCTWTLDGTFVANLAHNTAWALTPVGYCVSDSELYINTEPNVLMWNGSTLIDTGIPGDDGDCTNMWIQNGIAYFSDNAYALIAMVPSFVVGQTALSTVVADICDMAGLATSQYDVSQLTDTIWGYAITNHSAPRDNLSVLQQMYFFDVSDTDGLLKFVPRGNEPVATLQWSDLGAATSGNDSAALNPLTQMIAQEVELPRSIVLTYEGLQIDYQAASQRAFRAVTLSNLDATTTVALVLGDSEALERVQALLWSTWVGRKQFTFQTNLAFLAFEPTDVVTLTGQNGELYVVRLTKCQYDGKGVLTWTAQLEDPTVYPAADYTASGGLALGFKPQQIQYSGPTILAVLDIPPLRDTDSSQQLYLCACGLADNWPGVTVDMSRDANSYSDLFNITSPAPIGYSTTVLGNFFGGNQPDELNTVGITLFSGGLSGVDYADFLAGVNACYLGGELILFRNAVQTGANTYTLSGLLRGRVGTEWAMGLHTAGDTFVFLSATSTSIEPINVSDIGGTLYFEAHLSNAFASVPGPVTQVTPAVACVKPLSPALFVANPGSAAAVLDVSVSWTRRARVNGEWLDGTDVPLDEATESYLLTILNGATVIRTLTVPGTGDGATYVYPAATIATDGFTAGNTISFTAQQNSNQGVLGYAASTSMVYQ